MSTEKAKEITWEDLVAMPSGATIKDWYDEDVRCLIVRSNGSLCAYLGIPTSHPLAGFDYDNLPIQCHGGLTFSGEGNNKTYPKDFYWYGWDYAHSGDYCFYYDTLKELAGGRSEDKKWLLSDVENDMWTPIYEFKKLMKIAEQIHNKAIQLNKQPQ